MVLDGFRSKIVLLVPMESTRRPDMIACMAQVAKVSDRKGSDHLRLKMLTPKQMLQRLPIALVQVKAINISKNLLNEIR